MIDELWAVNEAAADYSFNRSHAACYALISYRTAWLRANYPAEYMAALISSVMSTKDKVPFFVSLLRGHGDRGAASRRQRVAATTSWSPSDNIRFGLDAVKNVGVARPSTRSSRRASEAAPSPRSGTSAAASTAARSTRRAIEALIKCGALDSTGATRAGMLAVLEQAQGAGQKAQQDAAARTGLDLRSRGARARGTRPAGPSAPPTCRCPHWRTRARSSTTGRRRRSDSSCRATRSRRCGPRLRARVDCTLTDLRDRKDNEWVTVGGMITECKKIRTRKGDTMMFATLDDLDGERRDARLQGRPSTANADLSRSTDW